MKGRRTNAVNARITIKSKKRLRSVLSIIALVLISAILIGTLYLNSQPKTYDIRVGQVAETDIISTRSIPDAIATEQAARQAELQTQDVLVRSQAISEEAVAAVEEAFDAIEEVRGSLYPEADEIYQRMLLGETAPPDTPLPVITQPSAEPTTPSSSERSETPESTASIETTEEPSTEVLTSDTASAGPSQDGPAARAGANEPEADADDEEAETTVEGTLEEPSEGTMALGEQADRLFYRVSLSADTLQDSVQTLQKDARTNRIEADVLEALIKTPPSLLYTLRTHATSMAQMIMTGRHDALTLPSAIETMGESLLSHTQYHETTMALIPPILKAYLVPNMSYDEAATLGARDAARRQVLADPIMIESGTRIVTAGDVVTEAQYQMLVDLELIDSDTFDWAYLGGLVLMYAVLISLVVTYLFKYEREYLQRFADLIILSLSIIAVFAVSLYVTEIHTILPPVYFVVVIVAAYFELRTALILSLFTIMLVYPMSFGDTKFLVTAVVTSLLISLVMARQARRSSYAPTILAGVAGSFFIAFAYGLLAGDNLDKDLYDASLVAISAAASIIAAIGFMPIFEIFLSAVSPLKLINLSQPSQPLLQRLFIEAPGTYQHSMMVANLAEAGAQQIGANALLIRVGAYYHDIGKLENPLMFTENQQGYNPHDYLPPEESVRIIMRHVSTGLKTAQKHRLPRSIQAMIIEHHGTTTLIHFYNKAKENAEREGLPEPKIEDFRYPWQKPQTKESAVLMLADTLEAAMKSTGISNIVDAEALARRLVKGKNDQDQLVESGLSFNEVETVIKAFMQVYAGQFHERVKYPDAQSSPQTPR